MNKRIKYYKTIKENFFCSELNFFLAFKMKDIDLWINCEIIIMYIFLMQIFKIHISNAYQVKH